MVDLSNRREFLARPQGGDHARRLSGRGGRAAFDLDTFIDFADDVHLDGVVEKITVPFLIAHGANDRQIPLEYAHRSYEQTVNSPKRELRVFTPEEARRSTSARPPALRQHLHRRLGRRHLHPADHRPRLTSQPRRCAGLSPPA